MDFTQWSRDLSVGDNLWLLVILDHFSKYVWGKAFPTKESTPVVAFLRELFAQVGTPKALLTDNGKEFVSEG
jgi:transposase InsO family protein